MIKEVKMYTVICDNCGADVCEGEEFSCWNEADFAIDIADNAGWHNADDVNYCSDCFTYDDNDELIIKKERSKMITPKT